MKFIFHRSLVCILALALLPCLGFGPLIGQDKLFIVTGKVYSAKTGLPLVNISVRAVNSAAEPVSTDEEGCFRLEAAGRNDQLVFTYPGLKEKTISIHGRDYLEAWLLDEHDLSVYDPVSLSFTEVPRRDIAGALDISRTEAPGQLSGSSFCQELLGRMSSLQVINRSGMPGEGAYLSCRGYASLYASSIPLIVVDGMVMKQEGFANSMIHGFTHNPLADLDKKDISDIVLLKDAVEGGLYGIKASNGVMLITTTPPRGGKTTMDVSVSGGFSTAPPQIPVMDAEHYSSYIMEQMYDAGMSSGEIFSRYPFMAFDPEYLYRARYHNNTNWQEKIFRAGNLYDAHLNVSGGDALAKYSISGGYHSNEAILKNTMYNRFNFRFNSVVQVSSRVEIGFNLGYTDGKYNLMETGATPETNPILAGLIQSPLLSVYQKDKDGTDLPVFDDVADFGFSNPAVIVDKVEAKIETSKFLGVSFLNVRISDHLSARVQFGLDRLKSNEKIFIPSWGMAMQGDGSAERSTGVQVNQYYSLLGEVRISYRNLFGNIHRISADAGTRYNFNSLLRDAGAAQNSATDEFKDLNSGKTDEKSVSGTNERWSWLNYYLSGHYILNDRYILRANLTLDASSRFGKEIESGILLAGFPFAVLPSGGIAWRISSESFAENINNLDELKLRVSYGLAGSDDFVNYYTKLYYRTIPYYSITGFTLNGLYNPGLKWEVIKKGNIGLDLATFHERFILNVDLFRAVTEDMVVNSSLPAYYGYKSYLLNGGSCENRGVEATAYGVILNRNLVWKLDLNFSMYRNKTLELPDQQIITSFTGGEKISEVGQPMGLFYGYKSLGVFSSQEEADAHNLVDKSGRRFNAGDMHFEDLDENGIIDEQDKQVIGNPHPDFISGIYNQFSYKGFSLGFLVTVVNGNEVFNYVRSQLESMSGYYNQSTAVYNRWNSDGQVTDIPRASFGDPMGNNRFSSRWIEDGSHIRLRFITLSYTFTRKLAFINSLNIYITGENLFTATNYLGYDPEFSYMNGLLGQGIDYGKIPQARSMIIGLKVGL